ncbi:MAG: redoxin family protein [Kiritimatiellae bacterium]|nr:redoxin family protein [Kiritimatiellia bacterium]
MSRLPIALLALAAAACLCANAGAFERKPFDRSRFAQTEAAGKQAVAAAATEAPAAAAPPAAAEPKPALREFFGKDLLTAKGKKADLADLNGKTIALYFSASWCPPCRAFTPRLVDLAEKLQSEGKPFEIVLVGRDQTRQKALDYMESHHMTGYLVPPEADANKSLCTLYRVTGIPYLVVVDSNGDTLDASARATVQSSPDTAWEKWSR